MWVCTLAVSFSWFQCYDTGPNIIILFFGLYCFLFLSLTVRGLCGLVGAVCTTQWNTSSHFDYRQKWDKTNLPLANSFALASFLLHTTVYGSEGSTVIVFVFRMPLLTVFQIMCDSFSSLCLIGFSLHCCWLCSASGQVCACMCASLAKYPISLEVFLFSLFLQSILSTSFQKT